MKVGDKVSVTIGVHEVAQAEVKEIADGQAVLIVPARRVVMGIRTELTDLNPVSTGNETVITGAERADAAPVSGVTPIVTNESDVVTPPAPVENPAVSVVETPPAETVTPVSPEPAIAPPAPAEPSAPPAPVDNPATQVDNA